MIEMKFYGCLPQPLSGYFKGLGILRSLVESGYDSEAKACWDKLDDVLVLQTCLSRDEIEKYFLYEYQPTPLIAPWNGSTGFYKSDNKKTINAIINSPARRFSDYQSTITKGIRIVEELGLQKQPTGTEKQKLLQNLRNQLPDAAVKWIDTCALVTSEELKFPPLMGTGGNDGNFEFSRTFMQQLQEIFDFQTGQPQPKAVSLLKASLFNQILPGLDYSGKIGQFNPIASGGANATTGYEGDSRVNPWDFVLMLEGMLMFAAAATRRYESGRSGEFTYPFMVRPVNVGYGSAAKDDSSRGEIWIPLWKNPAGYKELQLFLNEGRVKVGKRTAKDGLDFIQAINQYAARKNIFAFIRYSFQERNGLSYFAIPLGRFHPQSNPYVDLIGELANWLVDFDRKLNDASESVKIAHRQLKTNLFNFSAGKNSTSVLDVLIALGRVEKAFHHSLEKTKKILIKPIPVLSHRWLDIVIEQADFPELRLALSLVSPEFRKRLVPITKKGRGKHVNFIAWEEDEDKKSLTTWTRRNLVDNLIILLQREAIESSQEQRSQEKQLENRDSNINKSAQNYPNCYYASFEDINLWLHGRVNDRKIEAIARGLSLINIDYSRLHKSELHSVNLSNNLHLIPSSYAVIKLVHQGKIPCKQISRVFHREIFREDVKIKPVPQILNKLLADDIQYATQLAIQRLRSSRLQPIFADEGIEEFNIESKRIAAGLVFPISATQTQYLLKSVSQLRFKQDNN